jgi:type IV secretion system protein VirD4
LVEHHINPFDFIPQDEKERDRMINAFASSLIVADDSGGANSRHFDENAKILIRGYIDYMMKYLQPEERNLAVFYTLLSEEVKDAERTFKQMSHLSGRAAAASNQIMRVGTNERGSILSTSYRQIDWMSDSNMQHTMSDSTFNLRDFLKGNMDIYVILPAEQVQEHGRLVSMLMALLKALIVQTNPAELPKKKMLFLLDELPQLGYSPDVEQFIEVMRASGVVVWSVFQSLSQIEIYKKPDLFKGAPIKQIFTLDDVKTMQWVQSLAAKETVLNRTVSSNTVDSRRKMQAFGGTVSRGDGESSQETGVDLIKLNEIREMPAYEQFVFLHGSHPIRCHKVRYFEHPLFASKFDVNPVEKIRT